MKLVIDSQRLRREKREEEAAAAETVVADAPTMIVTPPQSAQTKVITRNSLQNDTPLLNLNGYSRNGKTNGVVKSNGHSTNGHTTNGINGKSLSVSPAVGHVDLTQKSDSVFSDDHVIRTDEIAVESVQSSDEQDLHDGEV